MSRIIKKTFLIIAFLALFSNLPIFAGRPNAEEMLFSSWEDFLNAPSQNLPEAERTKEKRALENFIAGIENFKMSDMYNAEKTEGSSIENYIDQAQNHAVRALAFLQENDFSGYRNECAATVSAMNSFMILTIKQDRKYFISFIELLAIISVLVIAIGISLYFYIENKKKIKEKSRREQFIASTITHIQENERSRISRDLHDTVTQDTRASLLLVHKLQGMAGLSENQKSLI